jgi:hypothetical protein
VFIADPHFPRTGDKQFEQQVCRLLGLSEQEYQAALRDFHITY